MNFLFTISNYIKKEIYLIQKEIKNPDDRIAWYYLVIPCFLMACLFHGSANENVLSDVINSNLGIMDIRFLSRIIVHIPLNFFIYIKRWRCGILYFTFCKFLSIF
jgi:hypothetical protein